MLLWIAEFCIRVICIHHNFEGLLYILFLIIVYMNEVFLNPGSESNSSMLTLDGVDVMGKRLADEVCTSLVFGLVFVSYL